MSDISLDSDDDDSYIVKSGDERRRSSTRSAGRKVNYNYEEDDDDDDIDNYSASIAIDDDDDDDDDDDEVEVYVFGSGNDSYGKPKKTKEKSRGETKSATAIKKKGVSASSRTMKSSPGRKAIRKDEDRDDADAKKYGQKMAAVPMTINSSNKRKTTKFEGNEANSDVKYPLLPDEANNSTNDEGIDIVIPHSLLDKSRGAGKNECMVLVQVANEPSASATSTKSSQHRPLDFHGQSGAIGRFEADGDGGTYCLSYYSLEK
jgi:hypothetical protein